MKNARTRKLLWLLALSVPVFLVARGLAGDAGPSRTSELAGGARATSSVPVHMSGSVIDLWYLWALRLELVSTGLPGNKTQQESQP